MSGPTVLFIAGEGRSGSTLLERVLARLPGVAAAGEVVHLWERGLRDDERCGCGAPFSVCPRWSAAGRQAFGGWDRVDTDAAVALRWAVDRQRYLPALVAPRGRFEARVRAYGDRLQRLYRAFAAVSGATAVIDSSKHVSTAFLLRQVPGIDLRVIHVVRDARGVANSWTRAVHRPESTEPGSLMPQYHPAHVAVKWVGHNLGVHVLAALGTPTVRVTYEDLVAAPRPTLARLARRLDLDAAAVDDVVRDGVVDLGTDHTVAGNPMRFRTGPTLLRLDDAWRRELPRRDRRLVDLIAGPLLRSYGYPTGALRS